MSCPMGKTGIRRFQFDDILCILTILGLEVVLDTSLYSTSCACGIVTTWMFFAWRAGTIVFYVLDGTTVKGSTSINIGGK